MRPTSANGNHIEPNSLSGSRAIIRGTIDAQPSRTTDAMPTLFDIRSRIKTQLQPLVGKLVALGATPAQLTWANLGLSAVVGALIAALPAVLPHTTQPLMLLPLALLVRVVLDALADMLAEEHSPRAPRDILLSEVSAAGCDLLLYLPLALIPGVPGALVVILVGLGLCTELAGLAALRIGASRRRDGPMGKTDRAIVFGLIGLILALDSTAAAWLGWLLLPASAMALATIVNRLRQALTEVA